jgi:ABC-type transporter Mla subunit MlaD
MATEARKAQVGLFVIGALLLAVSAAIWLGASRYFADEVPMVTYFSESVQGLEPGSAVKYRGVPAGRVDEIRIGPDGELIEVVMSVKSGVVQYLLFDPTLRAQLQLSGITGLRYVEIDRHAGDALDKSPELTFKAPYSIVRSTPSSFAAIQEALEQIYDRVMSIDLAGISSDTRTTLQAADQLLRDERLQTTLSSLVELSESASRVTRNVEKITQGVELAPVVRELGETTKEAHAFIAELHEGETGEQLRSTLAEFTGLARSTQEFVVGLQSTVDRLDRTVGSLQRLTDQIAEHPSQLLFSSPPEPRRGEQ